MKKICFLITFALIMSFFANAQVNNVGINETGENPNAAAMLDIKSANKGILIPRMNLADTTLINNVKTLSNDEKGLLIFAQDKKMFYYWDGTKWLPILSTNFYNSGYGITIGNDGSIIVDTTLLANKNHNHTGVYEPILTKGDLTTSSPISITGGTGAIIGTGTSVSISKANGTTDGYITKEDWNIFNNKLDTIIQGNGIIISGNTIYIDTNKFDNRYAPMNDSLTNHIATPWRIFYSDASGKVEELVLGNTGMVLTSAGMTNVPEWAKAIEIDTTGFSVTGIINFYTAGDTVSLTVKGDKGDAGAIGPQGPAGASDVSNLKFIVSNDTVILVNDSAGFITYLDTVVLPASQSAWLTEGNTGTTPATNFIGTKDNNDLVVKTNNVERMRVNKNGMISVNNPDTVGLYIKSSANTKRLVELYNTKDATINLKLENTGNGVCIAAKNSSLIGQYSTIQSEIFSNLSIPGSAMAAVTGISYGTAYGIAGQIPNVGLSISAVYGSNLRTGNVATVQGISGVFGQSAWYGVHGVQSIDAPLGALGAGVAGFSNMSDGVGVIGVGNNIINAFVPAPGCGGAFTGDSIGSYNASNNSVGTGIVGLGNSLQEHHLYSDNFGVAGSGGAFAGLYCGIYALSNEFAGIFSGDVNVFGDLQVYGVSVSVSDKKYKKNIQPFENSTLDKIMKLTPVMYEFRKDEFPKLNFTDGINYGFIAQDMEPLFPDLVKELKAGRAKSEYKGINYIGLIPIVVKGMQEQQEIINSLVRQNNELLNRIEKLEKRVIR